MNDHKFTKITEPKKMMKMVDKSLENERGGGGISGGTENLVDRNQRNIVGNKDREKLLIKLLSLVLFLLVLVAIFLAVMLKVKSSETAKNSDTPEPISVEGSEEVAEGELSELCEEAFDLGIENAENGVERGFYDAGDSDQIGVEPRCIGIYYAGYDSAAAKRIGL